VGPLFLVNWHHVHLRFTGLMWSLACALALVIVLQAAPTSKTSHRPPRGISALAPGPRGKP
jgi:hypothetical protein